MINALKVETIPRLYAFHNYSTGIPSLQEEQQKEFLAQYNITASSTCETVASTTPSNGNYRCSHGIASYRLMFLGLLLMATQA